MKVALFAAAALLAGVSPALAQVDQRVENGNCQGAFVLNRAPSAIIIVQSVPTRPRHTGGVRPPAAGASGLGTSAGRSSGVGNIGTPGIGSITTSGVGTMSRSGIGTMSQSGIGSMTGLGIGSIGAAAFSAPAVQSSPSPFSAPPSSPPAPGSLKNAVAPPIAVAPPLLVAVCP
jgi:hypothetical protein